MQIILCKVFFVQQEFFSESIIFRLNMDSKTVLNVFSSDFSKCSLRLELLSAKPRATLTHTSFVLYKIPA